MRHCTKQSILSFYKIIRFSFVNELLYCRSAFTSFSILYLVHVKVFVFKIYCFRDETTGFSDSDTQMLLNATHRTAELDDSFKNDPNKKASLPKIRSSVNEGNFSILIIIFSTEYL